MNDKILATLAKGEQNATVNFSDNLQLTSSAIFRLPIAVDCSCLINKQQNKTEQNKI